VHNRDYGTLRSELKTFRFLNFRILVVAPDANVISYGNDAVPLAMAMVSKGRDPTPLPACPNADRDVLATRSRFELAQ
jgi:hypothetical protein